MRALRILVRFLVFVLLFGVLAGGLVWAFGDVNWPRVTSMAELRRERVIHLENLDLYVVFHNGEVYALADHYLDQGARPEDAIYCDKSRLFETASGAKFDRIGRYFGGPAPRGLARYPVEAEEGEVLVNLEEPEPGPPRGSGAFEPTGPFCLF